MVSTCTAKAAAIVPRADGTVVAAGAYDTRDVMVGNDAQDFARGRNATASAGCSQVEAVRAAKSESRVRASSRIVTLLWTVAGLKCHLLEDCMDLVSSRTSSRR